MTDLPGRIAPVIGARRAIVRRPVPLLVETNGTSLHGMAADHADAMGLEPAGDAPQASMSNFVGENPLWYGTSPAVYPAGRDRQEAHHE